MGLGVVGVVLLAVVAFVALRGDDDGGDDGPTGDEDLVARLFSDDELELIHQAAPDPACAGEPTAPPGDEALVALEVVRVDDTCLDASTEYVAEDEVDARLAELDDDPSVVAAAPATPAAAADQVDDRREDQWALDMLGAPEGSPDLPWPDGTGMVVAVIDSGIDAAHPDLGDAVVGRRSVPDESTLDPLGHGTAVAGIVAARRDNGGIVGVVPAATILDVPVDLKDEEQNPDSWRVALPWAVNHGADAINMSLGQSTDDYDDDTMRVAVAVVEFARSHDVVVVSSGGNCGDGDVVNEVLGGCASDNQIQVPASLPGVVAVGALQKDRDLAGYSSRNEDVDLVAPGGGDVADLVETTARDGEYEGFNGTSAAAPHVAALAAAVRTAVPEATGDEISQALIDTADPEGVSEQDRDDVGIGHGLVDVEAAIDELRSTLSRPSEDLAGRTQAAYVHDGTLYAFDGDTSHPVREVGSDHSITDVVWSDDHSRLVGVDDTTLFSWGGEGSELVEADCQQCAQNYIAYLDDAAVTDPGDEGRTGDLVVTLDTEAWTLTRWSPTTLEPQGTVDLTVPRAEDSVGAGLQASVGGSLIVHTSGPDLEAEDTLWVVDPFSGESQASQPIVGRWRGGVAVDAAEQRLAYVNQGPLEGGTCADVQEAVVLDAVDLTQVAAPDLPQDVVFRELFFNGGNLYATAEYLAPNAEGQCPTDGSAGVWRADGDTWEQVDPTAVIGARPLEGMTGGDPTGWLIVTEDEQGRIEPREEGEIGTVDPSSYSGVVWATPTREEAPRGEEEPDGGEPPDGGGSPGGGGGGEPASQSVEAAIARYEEFLHALGAEDLDTVCEIAGPIAELAEEDGFTCEAGYSMVFDMISDEQAAALREATVDASLVEERAAGEVFVPVEAVVADVTFGEDTLGSYLLRYQDGDWFIVG